MLARLYGNHVPIHLDLSVYFISIEDRMGHFVTGCMSSKTILCCSVTHLKLSYPVSEGSHNKKKMFSTLARRYIHHIVSASPVLDTDYISVHDIFNIHLTTYNLLNQDE